MWPTGLSSRSLFAFLLLSFLLLFEIRTRFCSFAWRHLHGDTLKPSTCWTAKTSDSMLHNHWARCTCLLIYVLSQSVTSCAMLRRSELKNFIVSFDDTGMAISQCMLIWQMYLCYLDTANKTWTWKHRWLSSHDDNAFNHTHYYTRASKRLTNSWLGEIAIETGDQQHLWQGFVFYECISGWFWPITAFPLWSTPV